MIKKVSCSLFLGLCMISYSTWAADEPASGYNTNRLAPIDLLPAQHGNANVRPQPPADPHSKAIEFARQAGSIGGVTKACGQDIENFTQRVTEAIQQLTINNSTDRAGAMLVYYQIVREAEASERNMPRIPCTKVLEDYHNLPIMQPDYKEKVITQLNTSGS